MSRFPARTGSPLILAVLLAGLAVVAQALLVPLFAAPAVHLAPRDLPVAIAGAAPATAELAARLTAAEPGAFEITRFDDAASADRALRDREMYAAFVVGPAGLELHTAPAASPTVSALLTQAATGLAGGQPPRVVEVVPADPDDPRGAGFAAGFLPLAMTSLLAGALLALLVANRSARLAGLAGFGLLAGLVGAGLLQGWLGVLPGGYLTNAGAIGLFALATAATVAGLGSVLGRAGIGLGAVLVFLVGNALSAVGSAPELLPQPWGTLGQWLPVGAGGGLLRSTAFFDGAGAAMPLAILTGYALIGLVLVAAGRAGREGRGTAVEAG
nr:hypothetical protein [Micromonospora sp. DSM 115978]